MVLVIDMSPPRIDSMASDLFLVVTASISLRTAMSPGSDNGNEQLYFVGEQFHSTVTIIYQKPFAIHGNCHTCGQTICHQSAVPCISSSNGPSAWSHKHYILVHDF